MSDSTQPPDKGNHKPERLTSDALKLCDEFAKFSDECAFLCDAFAAVVREPDYIDEATSEGLGHYSLWMKTRVLEFKGMIDKLLADLQQQRK